MPNGDTPIHIPLDEQVKGLMAENERLNREILELRKTVGGLERDRDALMRSIRQLEGPALDQVATNPPKGKEK